MVTQADPGAPFTALMETMIKLPGEAGRQWLDSMMPGLSLPFSSPEEAGHWTEIMGRLQAMWLDFQTEQAAKLTASTPKSLSDPASWIGMMDGWFKTSPLARPEVQQKLWTDSVNLWGNLVNQYGLGTANQTITLPRADKRFADARWRENPFFALVHQAYLMIAEEVTAMADKVEGVEPEKKEQLRFATKALLDALSPDHFPLTNPIVMQRALETRGESLVKGFNHLLEDLRRGQLTHTSNDAFVLGENIAATPGKVVFETPMFQLIQYTPSTEKVGATPLIIFPPWINRFYILDLAPKKSFVKWAVEQGITTFMVSWKSADATMSEVVWDHYIASQMEAIEAVRERLKVPSVHTIGYCVAGTTLAATLAILARRGEAAQVASATFFTAQVDFEKAGDLKNFIDDQQIKTLQALAPEGYLDGRYLAATFNLLRPNDLIWNYVINNYLMGEDYRAFDLLYWNGDTTNLPAKWHQEYLCDLYRDNRLAVPDSLTALGTPIDLSCITTPCYIQAGREDHIAPAESVWRLTHHLPHAPHVFVLAGSGHIAGVVNPPSANKYQYWTNEAAVHTLEDFMAGARETPGSWWPHWRAWLMGINDATVPAKGKRVPGGRGEGGLEDAPGRYVIQR
jgi:polyhydroxyalkanoate synthase